MESNSGIPINKLDLNRPKLSIVIPCYNESKNLPLLVSRCKEVASKDCNIEIIIVDNNSTDDSDNLIKEQFPEINIIKSNIKLVDLIS